MSDNRIHSARQSLAQRLGQLEDRVVGTIDDTRGSVQKTVSTLTDTVHGVTSEVRSLIGSASTEVRGLVGSASDQLGDALDIRKKIRDNPVSGAAIAVGIGVLAWWLTRPRTEASAFRPAMSTSMASESPSPFAEIFDSFKQELVGVGKSMAANASHMLRDKVQSLIETPQESPFHRNGRQAVEI